MRLVLFRSGCVELETERQMGTCSFSLLVKISRLSEARAQLTCSAVHDERVPGWSKRGLFFLFFLNHLREGSRTHNATRNTQLERGRQSPFPQRSVDIRTHGAKKVIQALALRVTHSTATRIDIERLLKHINPGIERVPKSYPIHLFPGHFQRRTDSFARVSTQITHKRIDGPVI